MEKSNIAKFLVILLAFTTLLSFSQHAGIGHFSMKSGPTMTSSGTFNVGADTSEKTPLWILEGAYVYDFRNITAAISDDGNYIAVIHAVGTDYKISLFQRTSTVPIWTYDTGVSASTALLSEIDMSGNGQYIAATLDREYENAILYFFNKDDNVPQWMYTCQQFAVPKISISSDGNWLILGDTNFVRLFSKEDNVPEWSENTTYPVNKVSISSDGSYMIALAGWYSPPENLYLFDENGFVWAHRSYEFGFNDAAISADGQSIAAVRVNYLHFFTIEDNDPVWIVAGPQEPVFGPVSISSDGSLITCKGSDIWGGYNDLGSAPLIGQ